MNLVLTNVQACLAGFITHFPPQSVTATFVSATLKEKIYQFTKYLQKIVMGYTGVKCWDMHVVFITAKLSEMAFHYLLKFIHFEHAFM